VRPRNTLVLLLVLITLGGYIYFVERPSQEREAEAKKLVALKRDAVTGITLAYPDRTIVLEKTDGHWRITQPVTADADDPVVNNMVTAVAEADVSRTLDDVGDKLASYGLAPPEATITLTVKDGSVPPIKIGKATQVGSAAYLQKGDDPKVYIGTMAFQSAMKKQVKDLRDKSLVTFEDQDVKKFELEKGGVTISAERTEPDKWRITKPGDYPADSAEIRALLASLRGLRADDFVSDDPNPDLAKFGLTDPQFRIAVWVGKDAAQKTLLLGAFKDDEANKKSIYAKRAELPTVVTLPDYSIKNLDKSLNTLRDKTVLAYDKEKAAKVVVTRKDGNGFTLAKKDGTWHIEDPGEGTERGPTITRFLDDVTAFKGGDIMSEDPKKDLREYGLATPDMTVVVSDADGKPLATLVGARGPEPAGDPNAKAFVSALGTGIVYTVKQFVYDRVDKKRADFRDAPKPAPGASVAPSPNAPVAAPVVDGMGAGAPEAGDDAGMPDDGDDGEADAGE